ncbi:MAG: CocE/NonD family hydrolase [Bacteroidia bacterium]
MLMPSYKSPDRSRFRRVKRMSLYLTMPDGVELAVDVWLPEMKEPEALPTLLHQTRYWRAPELRFPFSLLSNGLLGNEGKLVREMVLSGYALVNVDCRGSGASFGTWPYPWSAAEVEDGRAILDWIMAQPWSNGRVGVVGISYTGTAAEFATGLGHPAIQAAMPMFSLYDVYEDIALPGGIPHDGFVLEWGRANAMLDENRLPIKNIVAKALVKGVSPVGKGSHAKRKFAAAMESHRDNRGVHETSAGIEYRDQAPALDLIRNMDDFSPHHYQDRANASKIPLLSLSGWMDGAYPHSSIRRYLNSDRAVNRLVLGPWDHGGKNHISPGHERKVGAEILMVALRFFDRFLKDIDTGIDKEPPVQYFTLQAERWQGSKTWPPEGLIALPLALTGNGKLAAPSANLPAETTRILHTGKQGTGHYTRWRGLRMSLGTGRLYRDRAKRDRTLAVWEGETLAHNLEVTGHFEARIFIQTPASDATLFVYLEDVTPKGVIRYVTEGSLRAIHREIPSDPPPYQDAVPYHSYRQSDARPLTPGEVTELRFDLLPTSYLFRKGHRIRIAIGTCDVDNFRDLMPPGTKVDIVTGGTHCSQVILWAAEKKAAR